MGLGVFVSCGFMTESEIVTLAPHVERLGFDGLTLPDHLFLPETVDGRYPHSADGKPPFSPDTPWPDGLVMAGAIGTITSTLRIVTAVHILPVRHPVVLAKVAATAARLCDGRLTLGVGAGWMTEEFDAVGVDFAHRGSVMNECIEVLRTLWSGGPVQHAGQRYSFGPVRMEPVPPPIPIVVGGLSDAALRRAARLGDGYIMATQPLDEFAGTLARLRGFLDAEGRDESDLEIFVPGLAAPPHEILAAAGPAVDNVTVMPWPHPGTKESTMPEKLEHLERYAAESLPALTAGVVA